MLRTIYIKLINFTGEGNLPDRCRERVYNGVKVN